MAKSKRRTGYETVRVCITINVALNARWSAAAALARIDRSEFAALALEEACRGLFLTDRRKPRDQVRINGSATAPDPVEPDAPDDAA